MLFMVCKLNLNYRANYDFQTAHLRHLGALQTPLVHNKKIKQRTLVLPEYYIFSQAVSVVFILEAILSLPGLNVVLQQLQGYAFAVSGFFDNFIILRLCAPRRSPVWKCVAGSLLIEALMLLYAFVLNPQPTDCPWCDLQFPTQNVEYPYFGWGAAYAVLAVSAKAQVAPFGWSPPRPPAWEWGLFLAIPYMLSALGLYCLGHLHLDVGYCLLVFAVTWYSVLYAPVFYRVATGDATCRQDMDVADALHSITLRLSPTAAAAASVPYRPPNTPNAPAAAAADGRQGGAAAAPGSSGGSGNSGGSGGSSSGSGAVAALQWSSDVTALMRDPSIRFLLPSALRLGRRVGVGGYGEVFAATWQGGVTVAVKRLFVFDSSAKRRAEALHQFLKEVRVLGKLRHPNCVLLLGVCIVPGHEAMVTEFMSRGSLFDILHTQGRKPLAAAARRKPAPAARRMLAAPRRPRPTPAAAAVAAPARLPGNRNDNDDGEEVTAQPSPSPEQASATGAAQCPPPAAAAAATAATGAGEEKGGSASEAKESRAGAVAAASFAAPASARNWVPRPPQPKTTRVRRQLTAAQRLSALRQCAAGMAYLHSFQPVILHRDLKSMNLLVDSRFCVKVCDFGLSVTKAAGGAMMTAIGTVQWAAPELLRHESYDERVDVYSFGVVAWELWTERVPFRGELPIRIAYEVGFQGRRLEVPHNCPPVLAALLQRCWSPAEERPTFAELISILQGINETFGP